MKLRLTLLYVGFVICLSLNGRIYADDSEDVDAEHENFEGQEAPGEVEKEKINFTKPVLEGKHHLVEFFDSVAAFKKTWIVSKSKKEEGDASVSKYDGVWSLEEPKTSVVNDDLALVLKSKAKHHAVSRYLEKPFEFNDKALVVQYEVKFQEGQECGGAYIKLLTKSDNLNLENFNDKTSYSIMFGPDKCGNDYKLHFIYRYKHPITGEFMEKHATKPSGNIDTYFNDKKSHLYTLVITPDNYYSIYVDQYQVKSGSLLTDVTPPLIPSKEIPDPNDKKPSDWDDNEKISDPHAVKPEDWDETQPEQIEDMGATQPDGWLTSEPSLIPDPVAEKPSDWDEDMDGEWEAPLISNPVCEKAPGCGEWKRPSIKNPLYKGKWTAPLIENPNYKGVWKANLIPNPDYFEEANPFQNLLPISAVGLELWSMSEDIAFDSFFISNDKAAADDFAAQTWQPKKAAEAGGAASSILQSVLDATHERPWLWAVIVVVIVLPVILLCAYCCFGSSSKSEEQVLHPKKTDETSPDDEVSEEELEEEEEEEEEDKHIGEGGDADALLTDTGEKKAKKLTKADLESKSVE